MMVKKKKKLNGHMFRDLFKRRVEKTTRPGKFLSLDSLPFLYGHVWC